MTSRDRRLLTVLALLSAACMLLEAGGVLGSVLLYAAPLLLLALPLLSGRYVGEQRIARLARARRRRGARPVRRQAPRVALRAVLSVPRGGRLIATSLAVRPPPVAPALG